MKNWVIESILDIETKKWISYVLPQKSYYVVIGSPHQLQQASTSLKNKKSNARMWQWDN